MEQQASASEKLAEELSATRPIRDLLKFAREQPLALFLRIAREYEQTQLPVPDHNLGPTNYLTDMVLSALLEHGLIERHTGRHILHAYALTPQGVEWHRRIVAESGPAKGK